MQRNRPFALLLAAALVLAARRTNADKARRETRSRPRPPNRRRAAPAPQPNYALSRADGQRIVPDRFLRDWDPVTIFFDADSGPRPAVPRTVRSAS